MRTIKDITAFQILDSRGYPTLCVKITDSNNEVFKGFAPSGASTGEREAIELRDGIKGYYMEKSVESCISKIQEIKNHFVGQSLDSLEKLDKKLVELGGDFQKNKIGGNTATALSFGFSHATSGNRDELYKSFRAEFAPELADKYFMSKPLVNIINGGKHAGNDLMIQEFMIVPTDMSNCKDALSKVVNVYHILGKIIKHKYGSAATAIGDEGGYAPNIKSAREALNLLSEAVLQTGYKLGKDIMFSLDCAASEFYDHSSGLYQIEKNKWFNREEAIQYYIDLTKEYPILSIEDPFDENDFESWAELRKQMSSKVLIVGDDLYTTNPEYVKRGLDNGWADTLLLKVNQIGTITESVEAVDLMKEAGGHVIVSHRSGETNDDTIIDLALGLGAEYVKIGAPARGERVAKFNRMLDIYESMNM